MKILNEYTEQATEFLNKCNASIKIDFAGRATNIEWNEKELRNTYNVTITTPVGSMSFIFWDSIYNTKITNYTVAEFFEKTRKFLYADATASEQRKAARELEQKKAEAMPTTYDILATLTKYDPGTFDEFCSEYGFDEDSRRAERIYIAVVKEFKQLERIFTPEQLEAMREIE